MQRRILFYLVLALVPMTVLALYLAVDERNEEDARARAQERAVVETVRSNLERLFQLGRSVVTEVANQQPDAELCRSFGPLRRSFPGLFNLGLADLAPGGTEVNTVCAAVAPARNPVTLTADEVRQAFGGAHAGETIFSPIRSNSVDGRPVIPISSLLRIAPDGTRRFVVATVSLDWLGEQVRRLPLPPGAMLMVLDRNGRIAAVSPSPTGGAAGKMAPEFERRLTARADFTSEVTGADGVEQLYSLAHMEEPGALAVLLKVRSADIFRRSRARLLVHLIGLAVVSVLVFGIAWLNSNSYVARPLGRLADVADRLAKGNLSERTGLEYKGEIGRLARSFDLMAEFLQQDEVRSAQMLEALRSLTARLDSVGEEERTRIAREIHDELGQQLTAMRFELARLDQSIAQSVAEDASNKVQDLTAMVDVAIRDIRKIATALRPVALDYGGLTDAIQFLGEDFERRTGIRCTVHAPEPVEVGGNPANCLYRICQESLTNVARHAGASAVEIRLVSDPGCLTLTVRDNGKGFDPQSDVQTRSLGLLGMRERARMAGGILSLISAPGEGTTVLAWIPLTTGSAAGGDALAAIV